MKFWRRLKSRLFHSRLDRELAEEMRLHIELRAERLKQSGIEGREANLAARRLFGNTTLLSEASREVWVFSRLESLLQDLRYGIRMLGRNPGFTAVAILALSLGIGINTAFFTAYQAFLARPLDGRDAKELVNVALSRSDGMPDVNFSYPDYETYRDSLNSFNGVLAYGKIVELLTLSNVGGTVSQRDSASSEWDGKIRRSLLSGASNAEFCTVYAVSENYFKVLGVSAVRGRTFDSIDNGELLASPSVLISENYWQRRFGGDPAILGKTVRLGGVAFSIAGITPHDFVGTGIVVPDFWMPLQLEPLRHGDGSWLRNRENLCCRLVARLAPHVDIEKAQAEMNIAARHLRDLHDQHSAFARPGTIILFPGSPLPLPINAVPGLTLTIVLLMAAAGMVLLVACANVASLQLARALSRDNELRTRLSLGASRGRIIRQLLTESALLGLISGCVALFLSWALLQLAVTWFTELMPVGYGSFVFHVAPDPAIFAFVFAVSLAAGVLLGLAPALESARNRLVFSSPSATAPARRLQNVLVTAQVALSLVLMIAGSLFIRSSIQMLKTDTGYDSKRVLGMYIQFPEAAKYSVERQLDLIRQLRTKLSALPEVASITSGRSPGEPMRRTPALVEGSVSTSLVLYYRFVQDNYFRCLGIPLQSGRTFVASSGQQEQAVILSESAAKEFWPGQSAVGRKLQLGPVDEQFHTNVGASGPVYEVVGVVRDVRGAQFDGSDSKTVYLPLADNRLSDRPLLIRTEGNPDSVLRSLDATISSVDPELVSNTSTLDEGLRRSGPFIASSLAAAVASSLGLLGLLLASMGIYGTVSYIAVLRTREVGIRIAIGAQKRDILELILGESTRPVMAGLAIGILLAAGVAYLLRGLLFGLSPFDRTAFVGTSAFFLLVALAAAYSPARRALRIDPIVALRCE